MFENKEINHMKVSLTTNCNLACSYCFVKKTDEIMNWSIAKKTVNLLLQSKGHEKLLSLYGGEPLLEFELIKKMVKYANEKAFENKKILNISICSNMVSLKQEHIDFFIDNNIKIASSLAGERQTHDSMRKFSNGSGSYDIVVDNLSRLSKSLGKNNLGIAFCVFPSAVSCLDKSFIHIIKLGFNNINFEIIRGYETWDKEKVVVFSKMFKKILKFVVSEIKKGRFIFINSIDWMIKNDCKIGISCPFNNILEVYPNGDMAFSPFLLNIDEKQRYIIGNLKDEKIFRYADCVFSNKNNMCKRCYHDYFKSHVSDVGADIVSRICKKLSFKATTYIIKTARYDKNFNDYVDIIKNKVCF